MLYVHKKYLIFDISTYLNHMNQYPILTQVYQTISLVKETVIKYKEEHILSHQKHITLWTFMYLTLLFFVRTAG